MRRYLRVTIAVAILAAGIVGFSALPDGARGANFDCTLGFAGPYPCENVDLEAFVSMPELGVGIGSDLWGWTDPQTDREYAIVATNLTVGFVDVTNPGNPRSLGTLPLRGTVGSNLYWSDVKVNGHYAYIVAEATGQGMQVFDLHRLRDITTPQLFTADATYDKTSKVHNIWINEETDFAYLLGANGSGTGVNNCASNGENGGLHMVDISQPLNPTFAGCALVPNGPPVNNLNYVHDAECIVYDGPDADYTDREICFGANERAIVIYDVTDKANPVIVSKTTYPTARYTHQGALTPDRRYLLFGDELDEINGTVSNTTTYIADMSDLDNPGAPKAFAAETESIDHNLYIHGDLIYATNYSGGEYLYTYTNDGLANGELTKLGFFDAVPGVDSGDEYAGLWSGYHFRRSGTIIASNSENQTAGLFVLSSSLVPPEEPVEEDPCTITGTPGNDKLNGTAGDDYICGLGGNDVIKGFGGDDTLEGGDGRDTLVGGSGADVLDGGADTDLAAFSGIAGQATTGAEVNLGPGTVTNDGTGASDTIVGITIENLRGTDYDDILTGDPRPNRIDGDGGNDSLSGADGNDLLFGRAGLDTLNGGGGADALYGHGDGDTLLGGANNDRLFPGGGNDSTVDGGTGNNQLRYNDVPGPITLDLAAGTVTGAGTDSVVGTSFTKVFGSPAGDTLTGTFAAPSPDQVTVLIGLGGDDLFNTLDGRADDVVNAKIRDGGTGDTCFVDIGPNRDRRGNGCEVLNPGAGKKRR